MSTENNVWNGKTISNSNENCLFYQFGLGNKSIYWFNNIIISNKSIYWYKWRFALCIFLLFASLFPINVNLHLLFLVSGSWFGGKMYMSIAISNGSCIGRKISYWWYKSADFRSGKFLIFKQTSIILKEKTKNMFFFIMIPGNNKIVFMWR